MASIAARLVALLLIAAPLGARAQTKPPLTGLVAMGSLKFIRVPSILPDNSLKEVTAHPGVYVGSAVLLTWKQLEPQPGRFDFSTVDAALANIRAYNARYPATPIKGKFRVYGGPNAPLWAMQLGGAPIPINDHGHDVQIGRTWSIPYRDAWRRLQAALAARYDTNPLVEEVAISSCAQSSAEPFHIPLVGANVQALLAAGYTDAAMKSCLAGALDDYAAWKHVALDFTFNPMHVISNNRKVLDPGFTEGVMRDFRRRMGSRGVIAFHGLMPTMPRDAGAMLDQLKSLGPPIEFQTRGTKQDMQESLDTGKAYGMTEFEIWDTKDAGGSARITADQLQQWRTTFPQAQ